MKRIAAALTILLMSLDTLTAQNIPSSTTSSGESKEISALFPTKEAKLRHDVSAYLGSILGTALHEAGMRPEDLDFDILIRTLAIELALQGQNIPEPEANETRTQAALRIMRAKMEQRNNEISATNAERSRRFLEENAKKPGIVTTPSGLQYRIDKQGTGAPRTSSRKETDDRALYAIKYTIDTLDGPMIDNHNGTVSIIRNHSTSRIPAGIHEALKLMQPGSKWTLYIPPSIGYGEKQRNLMWLSLGERQAHFDHERICQPCIGGNSVLIVQIELVDYSPNVPLSLDEVDSVYLAANPFWSKPALAIAEMQPILAHLNEAATRTPLHPEQTQYSSQELRKITSDTIAKIWANKMIDEGLILPDIDIPTFRNQLEQSLASPPSMEDIDKQHAAAIGMAAYIKERTPHQTQYTDKQKFLGIKTSADF
ncbi:FKBP-type peptidyl-prolyl cis-trans isomerase N-terminal domain-containing protein [Akkermansia glycaniphila]|uniref:peptidylprolyl isomerase n=1 Tax=Akkermansia glycaniphila TaxID=1679444 RepID=A0A1H6K5I0_9BACT|nr:FKBP-type peptidyl-prolyl cis-trans isomerase N-terminal domain-containing protein [Akkermansia glycaniphila]SEH70628.1 fkbp-type peptidyl-prolyl cis-trans isomerase [Akkermansia glycaniphila]